MFTLRRISGNRIEMNLALGQSYTVVYRERNYEDFCTSFQTYFSRPHVADLDNQSDFETKNVYAFIGNDEMLHPLYKNQGNYIMTSTGQTFDNVSFK